MRTGCALAILMATGGWWGGTSSAAAGIEARIRARIRVGEHPRYLVLSKDERELYVTVAKEQAIAVVETATGRVTGKIPVGCTPEDIALAPDGSMLIATSNDGVRMVALPGRNVTAVRMGMVYRLAITKDGRSAYLSGGWKGLWRMEISARTVSVIDPLPFAGHLALTPDGKRLYVNYQHFGHGGRAGHDSIGVFDAGTGKFLHAITGLANVGGIIAAAPDGGTAWANGEDACDSLAYDHAGCPAFPAGVINVIDVATDRLVHSAPLITPIDAALTFSPDGSLVAVGGYAVRFFDSRTYHIVAGTPDLRAHALVFTRDSRRVYATLGLGNAVAVIDLVHR